MITSLRLIDFRCFDSLSFALDTNLVFFTGQNAQGKTSILEAIAMASRLASPRASKQMQMVREGAMGCGVALQKDGQFFKSIYKDKKYELVIDGVPVKRREYLSQAPKVVWMESRDIDLIRGSSEKRRRYLDSIGTQLIPEYPMTLRNYTKILRSRNALLKEGRIQERTFQVFTDSLCEYSDLLTQMRSDLVQRLIPKIYSTHSRISQNQEAFTISYLPSALSLSSYLEANLPKEKLLKQTLSGAHRDDLRLTINERNASDYASEGQQRTLAVSLRLAQGALLTDAFSPPQVLFLIDDVFGELDRTRREALMEALPTQSQKLITTTTLNWDSPLSQNLYLSNGQIMRSL